MTNLPIKDLLGVVGPFAILIGFFYFGLIRPQKKRDTQVKTMRENLKVGDDIITIGGIMGKIIIIKEDYVVIESSALKTRIDVSKWGINSVVGDK